MKMLKFMPVGLALAASLVGVSSAAAANWDPQNTEVTLTQEGISTFTTFGGGNATFTCHSADGNLVAVGATAMLTGADDPLKIRGCTNSVVAGATTHVTTTGTWSFHAVDTTNVTLTAIPNAGSNTVLDTTIVTPLGACVISATGPVTITGNMWNNTTHTLAINNQGTFELDKSALCVGIGTTGALDANFVLPSNVIIT